MDAAEHGSIPAAQVVVTGTTIGVSTTDSGTFSFHVPADAKSMTVRRIGYLAQTVAITPGKSERHHQHSPKRTSCASRRRS